jgi:hypothetical protein
MIHSDLIPIMGNNLGAITHEIEFKDYTVIISNRFLQEILLVTKMYYV